MLEITTKKNKNTKTILMDGFTYIVRQPGAGESLDLSEFGDEIAKLQKSGLDITPEQEQILTQKSMHSLKIVLSFFDSLDDTKAEAHLKSIDPEELMQAVTKVFEESSPE